MRTELKVFRVRHEMTQAEFADKIGVSRGRYASIEKGTRSGSTEFWRQFQTAFNVDDANMWKFMKNK